ncbi:MAG: hypothetical protein CML44_09945 [Rhodobacteraceae bacterium]|jgi:hypothetical protein|nr:hypothetical protein [Paracoccaceae bacterium]MBC8410342.1 YIP1 family protein [Paracoccaceae bacterium]MBT4284467.1 YIP1 family protein [Paracoccaceae bacterium]MBT6436818.1 YIP1 family protein [Paracoccaceae bacterium]MDG1299023.1 Yip1 family protein [Paracoccaceae bacterium]|tara:strand:- start:2502 stop:3086 length:585 start_codon:yes stop_codon:yes gene_type:complete
MLTDFVKLVINTIKDPKQVALKISLVTLPPVTLWSLVVLVVIISVLLSELANWLLPVGPTQTSLILISSPFLATVVLTVLMTVMIFLTFYIGKLFGGIGSIESTISVIVWLQTTMIALQVVQLILIPFLPSLAMILGFFAGILFFWLYVNFILVLHGFTSLGRVFFGVIASMLGVIFLFSLLIGTLISTFSFGA